MGTDIHGVWQKRQNNEWVDVPSTYEQDRHYQLFAALAGVRNGRGFAGIKTGEAIQPISEPRGYPDDFPIEDDMYIIQSQDSIDPRRKQWREDGDMELFMGEHSHSWLTSTEMMEWFSRQRTVGKTGIVNRHVYEAWDKTTGSPSSYCGGVSGPNVVIVSEDEVATVQDWTHVQCDWRVSLLDELGYFFDEVKRLHEEYGEVRFVFGFDS